MQKLKLQILWLNDSLGFCINYKTPGSLLPLTSYYFWPVNEAWEQLKVELDSKVWIKEEEQVKILNLVVDTMNSWQQSRKYVTKHQLINESLPLLETTSISGFS